LPVTPHSETNFNRYAFHQRLKQNQTVVRADQLSTELQTLPQQFVRENLANAASQFLPLQTQVAVDRTSEVNDHINAHYYNWVKFYKEHDGEICDMAEPQNPVHGVDDIKKAIIKYL
jgi:hypothetical protein